MVNMPDKLKINVFQNPVDDVRKTVKRHLQLFNHKQLPHLFPHPDDLKDLPALDLTIRDDNDQIIAGVVANIFWGGLHIDYIWVDETLRSSGIGSVLMQRAEDEARKVSCAYMALETFDFQARPFYEKLGFEMIGEVEGFLPDHTFYYMRKDLNTQEE